MADVVFEKIAIGAALDVAGVVRQGNSRWRKLGNLVSRDTSLETDYPHARVETIGGSAHVIDLTIAIAWPAPIGDVCREVRVRVSDELARLAGDRPARVNVTVGEVVPAAFTRLRKRGFVEVPADVDPVGTARAGETSGGDGSSTADGSSTTDGSTGTGSPAPRSAARDISESPVSDPAAFPGAAIGGAVLGVVLLVGCGLLIRDLLAASGAVSGDLWVHQAAIALGTQTWGRWTWAVPVICILLALTVLWYAVKPRHRTHLKFPDNPVVWTRPVDVARRVSSAVCDLPGVSSPVTSIRRRGQLRITVLVTTTDAVDVDQVRQLARAAADSAAGEVRMVVKVRRGTAA